MSAPRKQPQQQRSQDTVDWILEAAAQLFASDGYQGTTTNRIADRAGVSIGSLYQYFPNKDALLVELAERHVAAIVPAIQEETRAAVSRHDDVEGVLRELVVAVADWHTQESPLHRLLVAHAWRSPALMARVREVEVTIAAELTEALTGMCSPTELDVLLVVQGINAQVHGALLHPPAGHTSEEVREQMVGHWCRVLGGSDS